MKRFINLLMVVVTGAFVLLYFSYRNERSKAERLLEKDAVHVDLIFDLEEENSRLLERIGDLEEENWVLTDCCIEVTE